MIEVDRERRVEVEKNKMVRARAERPSQTVSHVRARTLPTSKYQLLD